jgi:hypothetical protein
MLRVGLALGIGLALWIAPAHAQEPEGGYLSRADELVYMTARDHPEVLLDADLFEQRLGDLVGQALQGARIFGGWSREQLRALAERARNADAATDPGGAALRVELAQRDRLAWGIYATSLYGGMSNSVRMPQERIVAQECNTWRALPAVTRAVYANCLEYLLR